MFIFVLARRSQSRNSWMDRIPRLFLRYYRLDDYGAVLSIVDNIFSIDNLGYARWHRLSD